MDGRCLALPQVGHVIAGMDNSPPGQESRKRWWGSLPAAALAAGATVLGAWLLMAWSDAGAPSPTDFAREHPALGGAFGVFSTLGMAVLAWRRRRESR